MAEGRLPAIPSQRLVSFDADFSQVSDNGTSNITGRLIYQAVPEPATLAALGLGALAMVRRRRRA